jgi:hypothetical protein
MVNIIYKVNLYYDFSRNMLKLKPLGGKLIESAKVELFM